MPANILILYDNVGRSIKPLAQALEEGTRQVEGILVRRLTIEEAKTSDLVQADAIILGSPNWSGMTGKLKLWLDEQGDLWEEGRLTGKVGAAFTTSRSRSAGLEFTLLSLIHWMLAGGMIIVGLPWSDRMRISSSYYGAAVAGEIQPEGLEQAKVLGKRVAQLTLRLKKE